MEVQERKVFVCGLPREVNEGTLAEYFTKYGSVWRTYVIRDRITKNSKGHGFVWFDDSSSAKRALEESTGHVILGKTVQVKKSIQKNGPYQNQQHPSSGQVICGNGCTDSYGMQFSTKKIFVGGLPASLTREEFKDFFEQFGGTTDVVIMFDNLTQRPRGFGFVTFESEESVENVMQNNYYILNDRKVEVKRAVPKTEIIRHHEYNPSWSYTTYGGTYPGYSYFPGFYSMVHYWPPYPYGMVPFYSTGMVEVPGTSTSMFNPLSVKVNTHTNSTFSATADPKIDHVALGIGDLKLDADSKEEERGTASSS